MGVQEILSPRQTVLPKASVTDAARSCAHILWGTYGKVRRTSRDNATPRDISCDENSRLSSQGPSCIGNSVSPSRTGNQDIFSPSHPSIEKRGTNAEPFDASINGLSAVNFHSTSYFSGLITLEAVFAEVADVNPRERMNFASNSVLGETPKFVDLGMSPAHTTDKINWVVGPATRAGGFTDHSNCLAYRHSIAEVTEGRVSEVQAYIDYITNYEFETRNIFEQEDIQMTRPDQNTQITRPDQNIPLNRLNENIPLT